MSASSGGPPPPPPRQPGGAYRADVVVVGAGVAGLFAACQLPDGLDVIVVDEVASGAGGGSSPWAQGGIAVAVGPDDSPELHAEDTLRAGDGLADPIAVGVLVREGPRRVGDLIALGAEFDRDPAGGLRLAREGGQSVARSVHRADATGAEMVRALRAAAAPRVTRLVGSAVALAGDGTGAGGVWTLVDGEVVLVRAPAVLLATGGCGGLFAATTNQDHATADGVAIAWRAGAALRDLEFVQFHPTGLAPAAADAGGDGATGWRLLLTEALRGAGATLHDDSGGRFLVAVHPDAELAPRHVVTRAIVERGGRAWLDATHLGADRLEREFPTVLAAARRHGWDLATERVPVTPAAHYQIGGVRTDLDGRTSVPGLWAAGEVASTGCHGANRMAGNSLLEALVFGGRAAASIAATLAEGRAAAAPGAEPALGGAPAEGDLQDLRWRLRRTMWEGCGPLRSGASLDAAAREVADLARVLGRPRPDPAHVELTHAVTAAALLLRAATLRTESRGGHLRSDHPRRDPTWEAAHVELVRT